MSLSPSVQNLDQVQRLAVIKLNGNYRTLLNGGKGTSQTTMLVCRTDKEPLYIYLAIDRASEGLKPNALIGSTNQHSREGVLFPRSLM